MGSSRSTSKSYDDRRFTLGILIRSIMPTTIECELFIKACTYSACEISRFIESSLFLQLAQEVGQDEVIERMVQGLVSFASCVRLQSSLIGSIKQEFNLGRASPSVDMQLRGSEVLCKHNYFLVIEGMVQGLLHYGRGVLDLRQASVFFNWVYLNKNLTLEGSFPLVFPLKWGSSRESFIMDAFIVMLQVLNALRLSIPFTADPPSISMWGLDIHLRPRVIVPSDKRFHFLYFLVLDFEHHCMTYGDSKAWFTRLLEMALTVNESLVSSAYAMSTFALDGIHFCGLVWWDVVCQMFIGCDSLQVAFLSDILSLNAHGRIYQFGGDFSLAENKNDPKSLALNLLKAPTITKLCNVDPIRKKKRRKNVIENGSRLSSHTHVLDNSKNTCINIPTYKHLGRIDCPVSHILCGQVQLLSRLHAAVCIQYNVLRTTWSLIPIPIKE
ncbi:hypothetical protein G4B88_015305 [Cannabis sativa]|uniref:Uncharacterized protein n=1 Tax=Cannabis sativa TaxID=3483 RepID=A0A7J6EDR6_CANSA|nr:hypothetical protein G4B88_015305 [Cannabis sativa]